MIISLDTETTGVDFAHGAQPFMVSWCKHGEDPCYIRWDVDPLTRRVNVLEEDLDVITELMDQAELIYMQNGKFDARALRTVGLELPWEKVRDTLVAGHLLASNHPHNLTWMCIAYLGVDIMSFETTVKEVTQACRVIAKKQYPRWRLAAEGADGMPSVKDSSDRDEDKPWKNDMWLPFALLQESKARGIIIDPSIRDDSPWLNACPAYACADAEHTLYLGMEMERIIRERGLWAIYEHRLHLPRVDCEMEQCGVTAIGSYTESTIQAYQEYVAEAGAELTAIAADYGHDLELAKGAALNDNMRDFFYGAVQQKCTRCGCSRRVKHWNMESVEGQFCPKCSKGTTRRPGVTALMTVTRRDNLALPVIRNGKTGNASLDKAAMQEYLQTLDGPALEFIRLLADKRKHDTDLTYMEAYRRFWVPVPGVPGFYRIHPFFNPCGTDHLRQSSNSPNMQNVGGQEDKCEECDGKGCDICRGTGKSRVSLKNCFGPLPGREWWSMDYKSIEARLPAYESGEPKMIEVFEKPNEPPYWGNLYNLTASVLYPDEYWPVAEVEGKFRKDHPRLYKKAKFFVLAKNYGAGRKKGDLLSGIKNSYDLVDNEFPMLAALQAKYLRDAERTGYVETLPDRSVDPTRGYPILAAHTEEGRVLSTTPFNYHISGTACWCKNTAMIRCADQCAGWRSEGFNAWMCLEVHDELVFDFPRGRTPEENLPQALTLRRLMEQSGKDLVPAIPTPVSIEYHDRCWAEGVKM